MVSQSASIYTVLGQLIAPSETSGWGVFFFVTTWLHSAFMGSHLPVLVLGLEQDRAGLLPFSRRELPLRPTVKFPWSLLVGSWAPFSPLKVPQKVLGHRGCFGPEKLWLVTAKLRARYPGPDGVFCWDGAVASASLQGDAACCQQVLRQLFSQK